jgi:hypothetical protein
VSVLERVLVEQGVRGLFVSRFASTRLRSPLFDIKVLAVDAPSLFSLIQGGDFGIRQLSSSLGVYSSLASRFV